MNFLCNLIDNDGYIVGITGLFFLLLSWVFHRAAKPTLPAATDKGTTVKGTTVKGTTVKGTTGPGNREDDGRQLVSKALKFEKKDAQEAAATGRSTTETIAPKPVLETQKRRITHYGLGKTRTGFVAKLRQLFSSSSVDESILEKAEEILMGADIGTRTANHLLTVLSEKTKKTTTGAEAWDILKDECASILKDTGDLNASLSQLQDRRKSWSGKTEQGPWVILVVGVNGVGKTTTIGKLASKFARDGKRVILAAGDTFRAAASDQLKIWADRSNADFVDGKPGQDPTSVVVSALLKGIEGNYDIVIADTAGRLHNKNELMDELNKIYRSIDKKMSGSPHETLLVVDATTGQNAIEQAKVFDKAANLTSIVLTKLDGSAKGGIALGVTKEVGVPIQYVGVGEGIEDLKAFDAPAFIDALFLE